MIDLAVERQYTDCRELITHWKTFFEFFTMGVKGDALTPEKEGQFMQLKSRVAELHDSFLDALVQDHNVGQSMLDLVSRSITLKHVNRLSTADVKKMEIEWHESYLLLNDTIGQLEDKRNELALVSQTQYRSKKAAGLLQQKVHDFLTSMYFKMAMILAAVLFATVGIQAFGIFDWDWFGTQKWATVPYRWGKLAVRSVYDADSPWVTIDNAPRKAYLSWPGGMKEPQDRATGTSEMAKELPTSLPAPIRNILIDNAKEYKMEMTSRGLEGDGFIHSMILPNTSHAKEAADKFTQYAETPTGREVARTTRLFRDTNVVFVIHSNSSGMTRDLSTQVFHQPDIY